MGKKKNDQKPLRDELLERVMKLRDDVRRFMASECRKRANNNDDDLEDKTQEALVEIVQSIDTYREESGSLTKWGFGVATNVLLDDERARRRFEARFSGDDFDADATPSRDLSPEHAAHVRDIQTKIAAAMATMPEHLLAVFVLVGIMGTSHAEAAEELGISVAATKKRLERARDHIIAETGIRREDLRFLMPFLPWDEDANAMRLLRWRMVLDGIFPGGQLLAAIIVGWLASPCSFPSSPPVDLAQHLPDFGRVTVAAIAPPFVSDEPHAPPVDLGKPSHTAFSPRVADAPRSSQRARAALLDALDGLDQAPAHKR